MAFDQSQFTLIEQLPEQRAQAPRGRASAKPAQLALIVRKGRAPRVHAGQQVDVDALGRVTEVARIEVPVARIKVEAGETGHRRRSWRGGGAMVGSFSDSGSSQPISVARYSRNSADVAAARASRSQPRP